MPLSVIIRTAAQSNGADALPSLTFDGSRVVIGRGLGCDVRLPDPSVSQRHATVRAEGLEYTLVDEGSTNGTSVGEVRLSPFTPRTLKSGDLVRLGRVWLEMRMDQTPATRDLASATRDLAFRLVEDAMRALGDEVSTRVLVVEGPDRGKSLALVDEARAYVAGRGEDCDLLLEDMDASREHIQIVRRGGAVLVRDLGSKNGIQIGESRVPTDRDVPWRAPIMLRIGQAVLALEEPVAMALAELEGAPDESLPSEGARPPPPPYGPPGTPQAISNAAAPVAALPPAGPRRPRPRLRGWSGADAAVVIAAASIIVLSAAGLYWLLRG
jgi:pSer/pThr/pTyr-binding forkhead associated (FHA) protein